MSRVRHRARVSVAALLLCVICIVALPSRAGAEPDPLPTPLGLVSDFAGVIDARTEASLTARLTEIQQKTGAEIAVVTVATTAPDDVFDYAMRLAEAWKPGAADEDNGIVFLTAVEDRKMFILTGYGVEGALPDGRIGTIRDRDILPHYRRGNYAAGIDAGVARLARALADEYGVALSGVPAARRLPPRRVRRGTNLLPFLLILLLLFVILPNLGLVGRRGRRGMWMGPMWGGGFGGGGFGGHGGGFGGGLGGGFGGFGGGGFGGGGAGGGW